jgi:hypothetical protein
MTSQLQSPPTPQYGCQNHLYRLHFVAFRPVQLRMIQGMSQPMQSAHCGGCFCKRVWGSREHGYRDSKRLQQRFSCFRTTLCDMRCWLCWRSFTLVSTKRLQEVADASHSKTAGGSAGGGCARAMEQSRGDAEATEGKGEKKRARTRSTIGEQ